MNNYITFFQYIQAQLIYGTVMGILISKIVNNIVEMRFQLWYESIVNMYKKEKMEEKENDKM